jgi:hypothetical protein
LTNSAFSWKFAYWVFSEVTLDAHYSGLERMCACLDDWVFVGYEGEDGEQYVERYACKRCGRRIRNL